MAELILSCCNHCGKRTATKPSTRRDGSRCEVVYCNRACYNAHRHEQVAARAVACERCGVNFSPATEKSSRKYCSAKCWSAHRKAKAKNCPACGCLFTPVKYQAGAGRMVSNNTGVTCSAKCENDWIRKNPERKQKISLAFTGPAHPNWQGGKALLNNVSSRGPNWQKQRAAALLRDGKRCVDCLMSEAECIARYGRSLDVDHVVPFHNFSSYKQANALSNLQCRCASCHRIAEAKRSMVQMVLPIQDKASRQHKAGRNKGNQRLSASDVIAIRTRSDAGESAVSIAKDYTMVSRKAVSDIAKRRTWKHIA